MALTLLAAVTLLSPPVLLDSRRVLQRLIDSPNIALFGYCPLAGGCGPYGPSLPIQHASDVRFVRLVTSDIPLDDLRLLRHLPKLSQVRFHQILSPAQEQVLKASLPPGTWLMDDTELTDGATRQRVWVAPYVVQPHDVDGDGKIDFDTNHDNVIDERDRLSTMIQVDG